MYVVSQILLSKSSEGQMQDHFACNAVYVVQMRLMALLAVCSSKEGMEVSFKEVEQALALEEGQAEGWLVQAFGKQLLDGRINQVRIRPV